MASGRKAPQRYRLVVSRGDRSRVYGNREFATRVAAMRAARRAMRDGRICGAGASVVLQRGAPCEYPTFDAARIVPGRRGGWSEARWRDELRWPAADAATKEPRCERAAREPRRATASLLAAVAVCLFATITIFAMQRGGDGDPSVRSHAAPVLHELPVTAAVSRQTTKQRPQPASNLTDSLKAAMHTGDASDAIAERPRGRRDSGGQSSVRAPRGRR